MTMGVISYFFLYDTDIFLTMTIFVLVAAIMGFFPYNYHPAIIYLGDTGALFIGFMIGVLSLQGLKMQLQWLFCHLLLSLECLLLIQW